MSSGFKDSVISFIRKILDYLTAVYSWLFWPPITSKIPPFTERLLLKPATEVADLIKKQEVSAEDVVKAYIKRIRDVNPLINAIIDERFEEALEDARAIDRRIDEEVNGNSLTEGPSILTKPLLGVPFSIKDSFAVSGMRLCAALPQRKDTRAIEDSTCVTNLKKAGAIPIVVGNVPEMLLWWTADNKTFGRTNNPYDLNRIAGGSSGGDASLLSSGGAVLAVGSDIGGSIRIPCCMNGVFGHKTTSGVIDAHGKYPPLPESRMPFFSLGPMTRFASDLRVMLKAMAGEEAIKKFLPDIDTKVDISSLNVFYMLDDEDPLKTRVPIQIKETILRVVHLLNKRFGCRVKQVTLKDLRYTTQMFLSVMKDDSSLPMIDLINEGNPNKLNVYTEFIKANLGLSAHTRHVTLFSLLQHLLPPSDSKWIKDGVNMKVKLTEEIQSLLGSNGILLLPSYPGPSPTHGTTIPNNPNIGYFTALNLLELPATQVPIGLDAKTGLPLGIQVASNKFRDVQSLAVAELLEKELGGWIPPAPFISHESS
jgi:fatty acid amide hydrolase 2